MSVVDDVRKVVQDLVAPDMKSITERQSAQDLIATARHNELLAKLETSNTIHTARYEAIMKALDIDRRLERIEAREGAGTRVV